MDKGSCRIGFPTEVVEEGKVKILVPKLRAFVKAPSEYAPSKAPVFYNPVMELNRDIAVLALQVYQKTVNREISVCEPLTGCGVRGIRLAVEVEGVKKAVISDINEKAFKLAKCNLQMNGMSGHVTAKNEDANSLLANYSAPRKRFDVIDIDPFGSPVPYIDSALRALRDGGLLALTATDMASLCGVYTKACIRKYGGRPLRTEYCHELAVRLLIGCLAMTAAKHDMGLRVLFSHCTDHYIRVYATTEYSAKKADESVKNMGYILHCFKCFHRESVKKLFLPEYSRRCSECGSRLDVAGPLWLGKMLDEDFCLLMEEEAKRKMFRLKERIDKILTLAKGEAEGAPTYYVLDKICDRLSLPVPSIRRVLGVLREEGFRASLTHFNPKGIRTDASAVKMKEILQRVVVSNYASFK